MRPALLLLATLALIACGKRGDPLPPEPEAPASITRDDPQPTSE